MPVGGVHSVGFLPMSFQLVDSTVPLDSCITPPPQDTILQLLVHHLLLRVSDRLQCTLRLEFAETTVFDALMQQIAKDLRSNSLIQLRQNLRPDLPLQRLALGA